MVSRGGRIISFAALAVVLLVTVFATNAQTLGSRSTPDAPIAPAEPTPVPLEILPIAHCWEPVLNTPGMANLYFGYSSTYPAVQTIFGADNTFIGAPSEQTPVTVFYPGYNAFTEKVIVPVGTMVQWAVSGKFVNLDSSEDRFACQESNNITSVAVWAHGTYDDSKLPAATEALATVAGISVTNIYSDHDVRQDGFTIIFTFLSNSPSHGSLYTAMWKTVSDANSANSELQTAWAGIFGNASTTYSASGTSTDVPGSPLAPTGNLIIPVAHCWSYGRTQEQKIAYFGYTSNFANTVSFINGAWNFFVNAGPYTTPTMFRRGYNGFAVGILVTDPTLLNNKIAWSLDDYGVAMDLSNSSLQCPPVASLSFTIDFFGNILANISETEATASIKALITNNADVPIEAISVAFSDIPGGILATVSIANTDSLQYLAITNIISIFNGPDGESLKRGLGSSVNATASSCQSQGTAKDTVGTQGRLNIPNTNTGHQYIRIFPVCFAPTPVGFDAIFGYASNASQSLTVDSPTITAPVNSEVGYPIVLDPLVDPYSIRIAVRVVSTAPVSIQFFGSSARIDPTDLGQRCPPLSANVILGFSKSLPETPGMSPIITEIANITGYPITDISGTWQFDSINHFILTVTFSPAAGFDAPSAASKLVISAEDPAVAGALSNAAEAYLYSANSAYTQVPAAPQTSPTPKSPSQPPKSKLGGGAIFGIVLGVLAGVAFIGGLLFFFLHHQKGLCRPSTEHRPLLAE